MSTLAKNFYHQLPLECIFQRKKNQHDAGLNGSSLMTNAGDHQRHERGHVQPLHQ